jgi:hypothetical protein
LQFTVVSENLQSISELEQSFKSASQKEHVRRTLAKIIGQGMISTMKIPWKLTNVMVLSLEKVSFN